MLYGGGEFAKHWLFYQDAIGMFNSENTAGNVTESEFYNDLLMNFVLVGGVVSLKRFWMGLRYGQGQYRRHGKDLAIVMKKVMLIGKLAEFSKQSEMTNTKAKHFEFDYETIDRSKSNHEDGSESEDEDEDHDEDDRGTGTVPVIDTRRREKYTGQLTSSKQAKMQNLLGEWEEPETDERKVEKASIAAVVQFRAVVSCLDNDYPFSPAFGLASKCERCIESSQHL